MAAFLATAWFTIIVAAVPAIFDFYQWTQGSFGSSTRSAGTTTSPALPVGATNAHPNPTAANGEPPRPDELPDTIQRPEVVNKLERLLGPLCDLQAITGLSIVIAAIATRDTISFYHEQLVVSYWNITLNSFWASRAEFMNLDDNTNQKGGKLELTHTNDENRSAASESELPNNLNGNPVKKDKNKDLRVIVRRLSILASCILGVSFQIWSIMREWKKGARHGGQSGDCYNYRDGSSNWPWVVGLLLFCPALFLTLFKTTRTSVKNYLQIMKDVKDWFLDTTIPRKCNSLKAARSRGNTGVSPNTSTSTSTRSYRLAVRVQGNFLLLLLARFAFVLFWLSQVWLSVWAYGDTEYRITWWFYLGFCIWNSFDIISLHRLNRHLLGDNEFQWGFGQVLPLVMLLAILYHILDAFLDDSEQICTD
jgi:hypothetical protein